MIFNNLFFAFVSSVGVSSFATANTAWIFLGHTSCYGYYFLDDVQDQVGEEEWQSLIKLNVHRIALVSDAHAGG